MRHVILSSFDLGLQDRLSCLFQTEADVAAGAYEPLILRGADALLRELEPPPAALMIVLTCTDDLLGTDHQVFLEPLNKAHPDTRVLVCHMNPIMAESDLPPGPAMHDSMYGLWSKAPATEQAVNFIGNNVDVGDDNELVEYLGKNGIAARHVSRCRRFADFERMSSSRLNIVAAPAAAYAARRVRERLGIPYLLLPPRYNLDVIDEGLAAVCRALELEKANTTALRERIHERLRAVAAALGGRPVIVDHAASHAPFGMARLLMEHGIRVPALYASGCAAFEREDMEWVLARGVELIQPELFVPKHLRRRSEAVCIGFEAAYLESSPHVVTLSADGGLYGFQGILRLADWIEEAARNTDDRLRELIDESVLVI
jgi:nitrogenase molybdenum-iron protein alpha/beta subunit